MIIVIMFMVIVIVVIVAVALLLYLANKKQKQKLDTIGAPFGGPSPEEGPKEPEFINNFKWNGRFVHIEYERDPLPAGLIDQRPSVEGTSIVYKKLYMARGIHCSVNEAPMGPDMDDEPGFMVYYAPDSESPVPGSKVVYIARRNCIGNSATDQGNYRYLSTLSENELKGDTSNNTAEQREITRKRHMEIGTGVYFEWTPFPWIITPQETPQGTFTVAPLYSPTFILRIEKIVAEEGTPFRVMQTLAPSSYIYDPFKIRFI